MQRKGKEHFTKIKNTLLLCLLSGALLLGNMLAFQTVPVYAAESNYESQETVQPKVVASSYEELAQAIDEAEDGDVIGITGEILYNNVNCTVGEEDKNITIVRMNASSYIRMYGENVKVRFRNITFDGVSEKYKKAMSFMQVSGHLELTHCTFQNCNSEFGGAAIFFESGEANIDRCIFKNNEGGEAPHIYLGNSTARVTNSSFYNGYSQGDAGAISIYKEGFISLNDCQIYNNTAKRYGGGIYNQGTVKLSNTIVYGNIAKDGADILNGNASSFEMETLDELAELYIANRITPERWDYSHGDENYLVLSVLGDTATGNGTMRLVYNKIPESVDNSKNDSTDGTKDTGDSSENNNSDLENEEPKVDNTESEQPKDDNNKENENSAADNKDNTESTNSENNSGNDSSDISDSEPSEPEGGTATESNSSIENGNKENGSAENKETQDNANNCNNSGNSSDSDKMDTDNPNSNTPNIPVDDSSQTSNPGTVNPDTGNSSLTSSSNAEDNKPNSAIGNESQSGNPVIDSDNSNQNQPNTLVSSDGNNKENDDVSGDTNSGSGSSTESSNTNVTESGENTLPKPESNKDDSIPSDKEEVAAITDNSQIVASDSDNGNSGKVTSVTKKKAIKKLTVIAKRGKKKVTGATIKKATVKVKIGKKVYKVKSNAKGKFTIKLKGKTKLKKGQKIKITISKTGYKSKSKTYKVK